MSHPTLHIIAFSPARVNAAGDCWLPVNSAPPAAALGGPLALMRALAESILAVTGPSPGFRATVPPAKTRKPGSGLHRRLTPDRRAKYERIAARVAAGEATWQQAATAEGVAVSAVYNWNFHQRAKQRAALPVNPPADGVIGTNTGRPGGLNGAAAQEET